MRLHDKKDLINKMVNHRLKDSWSTKTMLDYLMNNPNGPKYKERAAYQIVEETGKYIAELSRNHHIGALEKTITEMESMYESAKSDKRLQLEIKKEINKLKGLYQTNINLSGSIDTTITTIKLVKVIKNDEQDGTSN